MTNRAGGLGPDVVAIGDAALDGLDALAEQMTARIRSQVTTYGPGGMVPEADLRRSCRAHARFVLSAIRNRPEQRSLGRTTGVTGAELGLPLPDIMSSYRIGLAEIWKAVAAIAVERSLPPAGVVEMTAEVWTHHENFVSEVIISYRELMARRMLTEEEEASALVESILDGRLTDPHAVQEAARLLRLPADGPYVVVWAEVSQPGRHALSGVRERLSGIGLPSAWRLLPDGQVGLIRVDSTRTETLVRFLQSAASQRIGVSPAFGQLTGTAEAVPLARLAMLGCAGGTLVARFEDDPIAIASVAAPAVMRRFARQVLAGLDELPDEDRGVLLHTLRVWLTSGGSAQRAAEALYCHPNTVRHRLRRLEQRTGRSVTDPRDVTALCLAAEARLRLVSDPAEAGEATR